jgi:general secretion pathway protein K
VTPRPGKPAGIALLITLLLVALLTIVVIEFTDSTEIESHLTRHALSRIQADYLAQAGVALGELALQLDAAEKTKVPPARPPAESLLDPWAQPFPPQALGGGVGGAGFSIDDESARFNVNALKSTASSAAPSAAGEARKAVFQGVLVSVGLDPNLLFAVLDWLDSDDEVSSKSGAEREFYLGLVPPYIPRNGRLLSLEELALVKGFGSVSRPQWALLRTVLTVLPDDDVRININTASEAMLTGILAPLDATSAVKTILARREQQPFATLAELNEIPGWSEVPQPIRSFFDVRTRYFTIHGIGVAADVTRGVASLEQRDNLTLRTLQWRAEPAVSLTSPGPLDGMSGLPTVAR